MLSKSGGSDIAFQCLTFAPGASSAVYSPNAAMFALV
jgi:hypothetical protein